MKSKAAKYLEALKMKWSRLMRCVFSALLFLILITSTNCFHYSNIVNAEDEMLELNSPIRVDVTRKITLENGGYVIINDTLSFSAHYENLSTSIFCPYFVGVPKKYRENLIYYAAYDSERNLFVEVAEENENFTWLNISLPKINIGGEAKYNFTLTMVFSDLISRKTENAFRADFPLYPSLKHEAASCNVTVILPTTASQISYPQDIFVFANETNELYNSISPLTERTDASSWVEFSDMYFSIIKILEMRRDIRIDSWGKITATDFYEIKIANAEKLVITLPCNSTNILVYDAYGKYRQDDLLIMKSGKEGTVVAIFLSDNLKMGERAKIAVSYSLPFREYIKKDGWQNFELSINLTKPDEWIINKIAITVLLPEGANVIHEGQTTQPLEYEKSGPFQDKITVKYFNVTKYEELGLLNIKYQYVIFWASFKPTMLAMVLAGLAIMIAMFTISTGKVGVGVIVPIETLKEFIEVCEEKRRVLSELESLREQFGKGKISKRQYQLSKKMFDEQIFTLQKKFLDLKTKIESAGGYYAKMVRQLDDANNNIEEIRRRIDEVDLRYYLGEISSHERRKLIEEYNRKKSKAESTIDEILFRLKEEIL